MTPAKAQINVRLKKLQIATEHAPNCMSITRNAKIKVYLNLILRIFSRYANKEATHTLPNPILVEYKIDIGDKEPPFRLLYNLLENKLAVLRQYIVDNL